MTFTDEELEAFESIEFATWCDQIDRHFVNHYNFLCDITKDTGRDCWLAMYLDGLTPEEASNEEVSNWDY